MSKLYVCKQYEMPYERVCKIITTLDEHDSELLDKVYTELEKYKREINLANTPWNFIELVFSKMKAEVEK